MRYSLLLLFSFISIIINAQEWHKVNSRNAVDQADIFIKPDRSKVFRTDYDQLKNRLSGSAMLQKITLPLPDGRMQTFEMTKESLFQRSTLSKYPELIHYEYSNTSKNILCKVTLSKHGLRAIIHYPDQTVYIDPASKTNDQLYASYYKKDYEHDEELICHLDHEREADVDVRSARTFDDCVLRTYRLALSCTGEYAQFHGGDTLSVLQAYNDAMVRVNSVYEREIGVRMVFIDSVEILIHLNPNSDPYNNNESFELINQGQEFIDDNVANEDYDIGHVFSTGGGGLAQIRSVCQTGAKASGITGRGEPIGDPFTIDYVCHEMGHQFGANHTQNNSCNRNPSTAVEPGSASTIMGYAGICSPNVQNNSDDYFHAISLIEMSNFIQSEADCAVIEDLTPSDLKITTTVDEYYIPQHTPFVLEAEVSDAEEGTTYCWEQMDTEIASMPPSDNNTGGPTFRSLTPTLDHKRYFPPFNDVLNNGRRTWEVLSTAARDYVFQLTVRQGLGCLRSDSVTVHAIATDEPFKITYPQDGDIVYSSKAFELQWNVANTDQEPVNCEFVDVFYAADGGQEFVLIVENTPNDGSELINIPGGLTEFGKIMIKSTNNIFYTVNDGYFKQNPNYIMDYMDEYVICEEDSLSFDFRIEKQVDFEIEQVNLSLENIPEEIMGNLTINDFSSDTTFQLKLYDLNQLPPGEYSINIKAIQGSSTFVEEFHIIKDIGNQVEVNVTNPMNQSIDIDVNTRLTWDGIDGVRSYRVELSDNPDFENILINTVVSNEEVEIEDLDYNQRYYVNITPIAECRSLDPTLISFQTVNNACTNIINDTAVEISDGVGSISSEINIDMSFNIENTSVAIDIEHTWLGDMTSRLRAPSGELLPLFSRIGPSGGFGCDGDDINITLSNSAANTYEDLIATCTNEVPSVTGEFNPQIPFGDIEVAETKGIWTLIIVDSVAMDAGQLNGWNMNVCEQFVNDPLEVTTATLFIKDSNVGNLTEMNLNTTEDSIIYMIKALPNYGNLRNVSTNLNIGDTFSSEDLKLMNINYQVQSDLLSYNDVVILDAFTPDGKTLFDIVLDINVTRENFFTSIDSLGHISCHGEMDGYISIKSIGGEAPYLYAFNAGDFVSNNVFTNLSPGNYVILSQDALDNKDTLTFTIEDVLPLEVELSKDLKEIKVSAEGGRAPYRYQYNDGEITDVSTFTAENPSDNIIRVIDQSNCTTEANISVSYIENVNYDINNTSCSDTNDGGIDNIEVIGGTPPYTYSLSQDDVIYGIDEGLYGGNYILLIKDAIDSTYQSEFIIESPEELLIDSVAVDSSRVEIFASGGTPPYQYAIDDGAYMNSNVFDINVDHDLMIRVLDTNGCVTSYTITSIDEFSKESVFSIYPNPSRDVVNIRNQEKSDIVRIDIYNNHGQKQYSVTEVTDQIDISNYIAGTYVLRIVTSTKTFNFKLVKI